jgi:hypothetical protein
MTTVREVFAHKGGACMHGLKKKRLFREQNAWQKGGEGKRDYEPWEVGV